MATKGKGAPAKHPGGRPTKRTPTAKTAIVSAVREGATLEIAAASAGVTYRTLRNWIVEAEVAEEGELFQFLQDLKKAESANALRHLRTIAKASARNWQASAWMLERRHRGGYGAQKVQHEHSGPDGGPIQLEHRRRDIAQQMLDKLIRGGISEPEAREALRALGVKDSYLERVA